MTKSRELAWAEAMLRTLVVRIRELRGEEKNWGPVGVRVEKGKVTLVRLEQEPEEDDLGDGWFAEYQDPPDQAESYSRFGNRASCYP